MRREVVNFTILRAITTLLVMAFSINIPILVLLVVMALSFTLYYYSHNSYIKESLILLIALLIIQLNVVREVESKEYIGIEGKGNYTVGIVVTTDSSPTKNGYWAKGIVYSIKSVQTLADARFTVGIISSKPLFKGQKLTGVKWISGSDTVKYEGEENIFTSLLCNKRTQFINHLYRTSRSPLLVALITGSKVFIDHKQLNTFRNSGCSHILAMSGFHVGVIVVLLCLLFRLLLWGNYLYLLVAIKLFLYLFFIGFTPSLTRSVIMFLIALYHKLHNREIDVKDVLAQSFFVTVLLFPSDFHTLSFKLSYLALLGILVIGSELNQIKILYLIPNYLRLSLIASLSALLGSSLLTFHTFETIYPQGILCSVLITPLITIYMWLGLFSLICPKLQSLILFWESRIFQLTSTFAKMPVIEKRDNISPIVTSIIIIIPVILLIIKLIRSRDARRFNTEFKL